MKAEPAHADYRLGIDIGGTFTDFILVNDSTGEVFIEKCLTTPSDPEQGVFEGVKRLSSRASNFLKRARDIIHATTLVTNVIIERKGAKTALLTTQGFRDLLELRREDRYYLYDIFIRFPAPLVPRSRRLEVSERVLANGSIFKPMSEEGVRQSARQLKKDGVQAIAIAYLHSYANPIHELRTRQILDEEIPGLAISLSHEVHPEPKEFERTSTTVVDAYIKIVAARYLDKFARGLIDRGAPKEPFVMLSNGGTATIDTAKRFPVQIVESGPAAGVEAGSFFARLMGIDTSLSFDMGGTTAKLCIVENGRAARTRGFEVDRIHRFRQGSGIPVSVPVYDLLEIGAGGGSIARINDLGLLEVGPQSAGAEPGPASYGRGGDLPTVTDADLCLGYLNPDYFLGGEMALNVSAAQEAVSKSLAKKAGLTTLQAAAGIYELVNETMAAAARVYVAEKAKVAGALIIIASGGAGPLHAIGLARKLGCPRVIIPPYSGVLSSLGLLAAPFAFERSRPVHKLLRDADLALLESLYQSIEEEIRRLMPKGRETQFLRTIDLRHAGRDYALEIDATKSHLGPASKERWAQDFMSAYERLYGRVDDNNPIEIANLRVSGVQPQPVLNLGRAQTSDDAKPKASREAYQPDIRKFESVPVYDRYHLRAGQMVTGPAIIEERESTTVIFRGDLLSVDEYGCLSVDVALRKKGAAPTEKAATTEAAGTQACP